MLQIQIGPEKPADPDDALKRSTVGWRPGMTEGEAWEAGRGVWKFNADRALAQDEVQIINAEGIVLAVAKVTGITKHGDRYALQGKLLHGDERVGRPTETRHRSRNSVGYF
jgi:hypothetical protein